MPIQSMTGLIQLMSVLEAGFGLGLWYLFVPSALALASASQFPSSHGSRAKLSHHFTWIDMKTNTRTAEGGKWYGAKWMFVLELYSI